MTHDRQITISVGNNRHSVSWSKTTMLVSEMYNRLSLPVRGAETIEQYFALPKKEKDNLKDVGGFVGGELKGSRRKATDVIGRDVVTLDFDNVPGWYTEKLIESVEALGCSYCVYSTRKHIPSAPRLRVVIPLDRTASPDEYEPVARRIAEKIGINMADPTTFDVSRLMYWPSCSSNSDFVFKSKDAEFAKVDAVLGTYDNWHDFTSWPQVPNAVSYAKLAMKQGDPESKPGIVGAFCRTYNIVQAMDAFLPNIYEPVVGDDERYTYLNGSTTGGAVVYENGKFLYSHHATDPCGSRLVNAFDLVRLHKFGDKDGNALLDTPVNKLPSYKEMCDFALSDKQVTATLNREQLQKAAEDFKDVGNVTSDEDSLAWADELSRGKDGKVIGTIDNILVILDNDNLLKGKFALNEFANRGEVLGPLPWRRDFKGRRLWDDSDNDGLYWYLEKVWEINKKGNIDSALSIHTMTHAFNEVQDYIQGLTWDNTPRLDNLFIDYLGAEDSDYNRAVTRKSFTAAIARAMQPGCKYDNMLILAGPQGIGKSTLLDRMSRGWFNDSIRTFEGKEASELLQGVWLVEVSELDAFRRTDVARIKQFLSLRADRYRAAYGRHVKELPRCCVFFGTTNTTDFLQDTTGNRRFWPVDVGVNEPLYKVWDKLDADTVNQLWAEAKTRWQLGEELYLTGELEEVARIKQEEHREVSVREDLIIDFINRKIPSNWQCWSLDRRRDFWAGAIHTADGSEIKLIERKTVTALEIWCELFNGNIKDMKSSDTKEINAVLARQKDWQQTKNAIRPGKQAYNCQKRGFERV